MALPKPMCLVVHAVNLTTLDRLFGKHIKDICDHYHDNDDNQCAHFVSHVLRYKSTQSRALCTNVRGSKILEKGSWTKEELRSGYTIRVDDIFNESGGRARWSDEVKEVLCLIFATIPANVRNTDPISIGSMTKKHVGFHIGGNVYHYSNGRNKVVKQPVSEFKTHYGSRTVLLRADIPHGC